MKTTIRLEDVVYAEVKRLAAHDGKSISAFIEDSLRQTLATGPTGSRTHLNLTTFKEDGLFPNVKLDSSEALFELMETPDSLN